MNAASSAGAVLWMEEALAGEGRPIEPPLSSDVTVDVCIVGGGYTGLWTALELKQCAPDLRVMLIESTTCGAGASGRNGGWVTGWYDELPSLIGHFGRDQALWLAAQAAESITRIETTAAAQGFDAEFRRRGALWTATDSSQGRPWEPAMAACRELGHADKLELVSTDEVRRRTRSPLPVAAARQTDSASVHPGRLVRGLRRVAIQVGVQVHEATPMLALSRGFPAVLQTPMGTITAAQVVLATGAWAASLRELRRALIPAASHVVATEPLPREVLGDWADGELFGDSRLQVHYAQVTRSGRVVFGRGGGAIGALGQVRADHYWDAKSVARVRRDLVEFFPGLTGARITHVWGGAVDRAPHHLPFVGSLGEAENIHYGVGYSGNGVGPSALIGRILGRRALGIVDEFTTCALVSGPPAYLPPDPFRYVGGNLVQAGIARAEAAEGAGHRPDPVSSLLRRLLWTTTPAWAEPRLRRSRRGAYRG